MVYHYNWASFSNCDEMKGNKRSGIYCIGNVINKNVYIGSTVCFHDRYTKHLSSFNTGKVNAKLGAAIKEHGIGNFLFFVLQYVDDVEKLESRERYYITEMGAPYNVKKDVKRYDYTTERNANISKTLQKTIKRGEDSPMFGIKRPKEVVNQIFETRNKIKEKLYENMSDRVIQIDLHGNFLAEYRSINVASKIIGMSREKIMRICKNEWNYKTKDEFTFMYKKNYKNGLN